MFGFSLQGAGSRAKPFRRLCLSHLPRRVRNILGFNSFVQTRLGAVGLSDVVNSSFSGFLIRAQTLKALVNGL